MVFMTRTIDLHAHTTASDGDLSPTQLIWWAKASRLSALAVTDHDTTDGIAEATLAGQKYGVEVIPGIELSADIDIPKGQCHLLGYLFDPNHAGLNARLAEVRANRNTRNARIVEKIQAHGWNVTLEEIEAVSGSEVVARPHIARVLVDRGFVGSMVEAFDTYLGKGGLFYVERDRLNPGRRKGITPPSDRGGQPVPNDVQGRIGHRRRQRPGHSAARGAREIDAQGKQHRGDAEADGESE